MRVYLGKDANGKKQYASITRLDKNDCIIEAAQLAKHHHEIVRDPGMMTLSEAIDEEVCCKG